MKDKDYHNGEDAAIKAARVAGAKVKYIGKGDYMICFESESVKIDDVIKSYKKIKGETP